MRNRVHQTFSREIMIRVAGWGLGVFLAGCESDLPPAAQNLPWEVVLTGTNFCWEITDPGRDGKLGTVDDLHLAPPLRLPANIPTRVLLRSRDYLYTFELTALQIKQIAIPDLTYFVEFNSGKPGESEFRGDQFCNNAHNALSGTVIIQSWRDYRRWQAIAETEQQTQR